MNPNDPNVVLLERVAEQLGRALLEQLVFVGGAVAGVLITDPVRWTQPPSDSGNTESSAVAGASLVEADRVLIASGLLRSNSR